MALWLTGVGAGAVQAECTPRAVVIGVSVYRDTAFQPVLHAKNDAEAFGDWFKHRVTCGSGSRAGVEPVIEILTNEQATGPAIRNKLQEVFLRASRDDEVFIFISARGIKAPGYGDDGYLIGHDGRLGRLYSSGITVENLGDIIPSRGIGRVFLFADISRDLPNENEIVSWLKTGLAENPSMAAVLSTQPKRISTDTNQYPQGLFTHFLVEELMASPGGKVTIPILYQSLRRKILQASKARQDPLSFGNESAVVDSGAERVLIASLAPPPASAFADQEPGPSAGAINEVVVKLDEAVEAEEKAQQVLLRYGEGNQFPDDPLRPKKSDFDLAANLFDKARLTRPGLASRSEGRLRDSLRARMLFCRGRALIFEARYDEARGFLEQARLADPLLPEPENAIGITFLERSQYESAVKAFQQSIRLAPGWGYPRHNLALTYIERGDNIAAEAEYRGAIRSAPTQPYLYYNLGILLERLNRRAEAERVLREAVRRFEDQAAAYRSQAERLSESSAAVAIEEALTVRRNEGEVYNALGALSHGKKARQSYIRALELNDKLYAAQYNLGIVAMRSHDYPEAIRRLETVVQSGQSFPGAERKLDCARKRDAFSKTRDRKDRTRIRRDLRACEG